MKIPSILRCCLTAIVIACFCGCSSDMEEPALPPSSAVRPIPVTLHATLTPFDTRRQAPAARATALSWKEGDIIYLQYTAANGGSANGTLTYSGGKWELSAAKSLKRDATTKCKAYYFDGETTVTSSTVTLSPTTGVYADLDASYIYPTDDDLAITCHLKPQTSRLRFKGTKGTIFSLEGMSCSRSFTLSTVSFNQSTAGVAATIQSDGYSPYIYGTFADASAPQLVVKQGDDTFTAECKGLGMLITGESGYMTLPTTSVHNGWEMMKESANSFTVGGVNFKMILVEHGTFQMGSTTGYSDENPVHSVTISKDYYIGETEVTQALWKAVTGYSPTSDGSSWISTNGLGDNYPAYFISYEDVQSFITKLNQMTGRQFRMPTEAEWEYAAKGGNKSKGYTYSGSNTIGDVAWYKDNSGSKTHPVKTKTPNELGIYDMSGNVWEWCSDWYGSYSSGAVTDPTGATSGSYRVCRGGSWRSGAAGCRSAIRDGWTPSGRHDLLGFRLAL